MSTEQHPDLEHIAADFDRFLSAFFDRRGWRAEVKFDPAADTLYLVVRLADSRLSKDDRFLSLVEQFARARGARVRQRTGLPLKPRLYTLDGSDITSTLRARGASNLDDGVRATRMRRRLVWLGLRRRLVGRILPGALLWAATIVFVVHVLGLAVEATLLLAVAAVVVQITVNHLLRARRR